VSTIQIQAPGLFATVQDLGRDGFGPIGVSPSGAADPISLRLGNRLVMNDQSAAGLEMALLGGTFSFPQGAVLALTGSDFGATLDDSVLEMWTSVNVRPGQTVRLGPTRSGARCYLCVHGGIAVTPFLGSASTQILGGLGGFEGRALRKGDVLEVGPKTESFHKRVVASQVAEQLSRHRSLRVTRGPQADWFPPSSRRTFYAEHYRIREQCDRMGVRLEGASVLQPNGKRMITEGASLGAVQVPPGGSPIILFVEQQTTGGYPKIANVISADLHRIGQLRPRDEVQFTEVTIEIARSVFIEQEELLASREIILE
jgi:antagonist of KipI